MCREILDSIASIIVPQATNYCHSSKSDSNDFGIKTCAEFNTIHKKLHDYADSKEEQAITHPCKILEVTEEVETFLKDFSKCIYMENN